MSEDERKHEHHARQHEKRPKEHRDGSSDLLQHDAQDPELAHQPHDAEHLQHLQQPQDPEPRHVNTGSGFRRDEVGNDDFVERQDHKHGIEQVPIPLGTREKFAAMRLQFQEELAAIKDNKEPCQEMVLHRLLPLSLAGVVQGVLELRLCICAYDERVDRDDNTADCVEEPMPHDLLHACLLRFRLIAALADHSCRLVCLSTAYAHPCHLRMQEGRHCSFQGLL
mmetsp:Transcript_67197/g.160981  ORF Transcript_67197/g.160981 Transcript_67197/m.160981 type:complete len:224 (+) Transcript_67197:989-1660(+)